MAPMRLTPWEEERLLIYSAAELARRQRSRGLLLNAPEAVAIICDAMLDAARGGASYAEVEAAGRAAVSVDQVLAGIPALVDEVRLEVLLDDGTRIIVLREPLGPAGRDGPGAIRVARNAPPPDEREHRTIEVHNGSTRVVRVSSHHPFDRVNPRLEFDRDRSRGFHLDLPAGSTERWAPGETRSVTLVGYRGDAGR